MSPGQFGSQDAKKNKYSNLEISNVYCDISLSLQVKCPDSAELVLKQLTFAKQDIEDDSCVTRPQEGQSLVHDVKPT